jgi:hypothetical protein
VGRRDRARRPTAASGRTGMDLKLNDQQQMLRDATRQFAEQR